MEMIEVRLPGIYLGADLLSVLIQSRGPNLISEQDILIDMLNKNKALFNKRDHKSDDDHLDHQQHNLSHQV
jgi:hypothetical protein